MMKFISFCSLNLLLANLSLFGGNPSQPETLQNIEKPKISFTENKGQVYDQNYKPRFDVLYGAMAGNMAVHIKKNGVSYQLYRVDKYKEVEDLKTKEKRQKIDQQTIYRVDLTWVNANKNFTKSEDEALPGYNNYYLESCPNGALNVKSYKGITLNNLYPGINLHYYEKNGELKHDYIVAPHADYKQIQIKIEGAELNVNKDGSLLITTPLGKIQEGAPLVYQNGKQLKAKWLVKNNTLSFEIENYNPNSELIIDPVTRLWGTYYGDTGSQYGNSCITDLSGNVYIAGDTHSNTGTVMATAGSHQSSIGGLCDAFLVKFNSGGQRQWGTYYGGIGWDVGSSCSSDAFGNVYLSGWTASNSGTIVASGGSHQSTFGGGQMDAYLVKFNGAGQRQWGTYYGGTGDENGWSCSTDFSGNVYLAGRTNSGMGTVIATVGSHQPTPGGGGNWDAFLVKFDSTGLRLWGTYYGSSGSDYANSCSTDASGNAYLAGVAPTTTGTIIATLGSHQSINGGQGDAFLVKFDNGGIRQWGTYYGGPGTDVAYSCSTDASGNVYLAGITDSNTGTLIATGGSHQSTHGGGPPGASLDAFLVKFNSAGQRQWGTYYGGGGVDYGYSCSADTSGNVYLAGDTQSNTGTVMATAFSHQSSFGGQSDAFLVKFNFAGQRQWGTYYGGTMKDAANSVSTDLSDKLYLTGVTDSNNGTVIATPGSHQSIYGGLAQDAFLVKFKDCSISSLVSVNSGTICQGESFTITPTGAITYSVSGGNFIVNPNITTSYSVIGTSAEGCISTAVCTVLVDMCMGIDANSEYRTISIYPNPSSGILNIESDTEGRAMVVDLLGRIVWTLNTERGTNQFSIEHLENGVYFVEVIHPQGKQVFRVIKQ